MFQILPQVPGALFFTLTDLQVAPGHVQRAAITVDRREGFFGCGSKHRFANGQGQFHFVVKILAARRVGGRTAGKHRIGAGFGEVERRLAVDLVPHFLGDLRRRHDTLAAGDGGADQDVVGAFAVLPHALLDVDELVVPTERAGAHLDLFHHADTAAVARAGACDRQAPLAATKRIGQPRGMTQRDAAHIVERQGAAVVQLDPEIEVPRQAIVMGGVDITEGNGAVIPVFEGLPEDLQSILQTAMRLTAFDIYVEATAMSTNNWETMLQEYPEIKVRSFPKEVLVALKQANDELLAEYAERDPLAKEIIESQQAFAKKARAYTLISDYGYLQSTKDL